MQRGFEDVPCYSNAYSLTASRAQGAWDLQITLAKLTTDMPTHGLWVHMSVNHGVVALELLRAPTPMHLKNCTYYYPSPTW